MIFNQRLFWLLLPCSLTSLSTISFSSSESSNLIQSKAEDKELSIEEELAILSKIGTSDKFLEFGSDINGPKSLEDLVKNYLKTTSGAKELARRLTQHLIVNLIDGYANSKSAINDRLEGKLRTLRNNSTIGSLGDKERKEARFLFAGDEDAYKEDQVLQKSREIFEPVLNDVLGELNFNDKAKFKKEDDGDPLKVLFSGFWDHVLDDYLKYERPITFKKLTWNYDTVNRKEDIKKLFDNPDSSLPEKASYHFPFISRASESKFKAFLEAIKEKTPASEILKKHSDNSNIDLVIPISSIIEGKYTSQSTIAILQALRYLFTKEKFLDSENEKKVLRNATDAQDFNCDINSEIPSAFLEKFKENWTTEELFCLKNGKGNNGSRNLTDFVYLIQKEKEKEPSWILFKDKDGIHALTYDSDVFVEKKYEPEKLKQNLIVNKNFDLKSNLGKHLNKHFERLILGYWSEFFKQEQEQEQEWKNRAKKLIDFLLKDTFSNNLISLRKILFRDYLDTDLPIKKNNLKLSFTGKFPYKFFPSPLLSSAFLKVEKSYTDYSETLDGLFNENQSKRHTWDKYNFFKFNDGINLAPKEGKIKQIKNSDLFESVWKSLLQDSKLSEVLFAEKIKKDVDYFDLENWKKAVGSGSIDSIDKFKFKDGENSKNIDNLIFNYLHSQYIDLNKDLSIPQILEDFDFEKVSKEGENKELKEFLEKTVKKFKSTLSSSSSDVSRGGVLTDLFTIKWLIQNNFENFRSHLRKNLKRDSLSGFVFSKKFSEKDKCLPRTWEKAKISENLEVKNLDQKSSFIFRKAKTKDEDLTCLVNSDIVNFASVKIENEVKYLTGYKGLVNSNWKDLFPEDIVNVLQNKISLWKDTDSLISYINETVTSDSKYEELIKLLRNSFPNHTWDFSSRENCKNFNFDWNSGPRSSCLSTSSASFNDRKELLKSYLRQHPNLFNSKSNSYNNWVIDKDGNYLIKSTDGAHHQIYLVQIKYDDVENQESWKKYLESIDSSYFFRELIKTAKDSKVKQQALLDGLTSGEGSLKDFKTGDDRLRRALGYSWLKSTRN